MPMIPGLVSVILPVFNRPRGLVEAVESVRAQTYPNWELIIVDDGSTDETGAVADEIARHARGAARVVHIPNVGPGCAREAGRALIRGEFVQYLDSDDLLEPEKFSRQVAGLRSHPECVVSYGAVHAVNAAGERSRHPIRRTGEAVPYLFPSFLTDRWWPTLAPLHRAAVVEKLGPWLPLRVHEDWEYDCRIAALGMPLNHVPGPPVAVIRDLPGPRSGAGGRRFDAARLRDRAVALLHIRDHALEAGLAPDLPEMRHFARHLFLLARDCAAAGVPGLPARLLSAAVEIEGCERPAVRAFSLMARVAGWRAAGLFARSFEGIWKLARAGRRGA